MVQPINYLPQPTENTFLQGIAQGAQLGEAFKAIQEQNLAKQQAQQRLQQYRSELESAFSSGRPEAFERLITIFPEHQAALKQAYERLSDDAKKSRLTEATNIRAAIESGNFSYAKQLIERQIKANENSGKDASQYKTLLEQIDVNPKIAASSIDYTISSILPPKEYKDWAEGISKVKETARAEELAPITRRKESADVIAKELANKFAPEKIAADLGLTKAQTEQAKAAAAASRADAAKSGAEAARAQAEARQMGAGIIPLEKRPEMESKFRKEYSDQTRGYQEVKSAYGRILASENSAVGDISLIFGYMKMLDPESVVREGEFATAEKARGVPESVLNIYNKLISGRRLNSSQRKSFKGQADKLYKTAATQEETVRKGIERIATGYGLKTENIFYAPTEVAPTAPVEVPEAKQTPEAPQPAQSRIDQLLKKYGPR